MSDGLRLPGVMRLDETATEQGVTKRYPGSDVSVTILPAAMFNPRVRRMLMQQARDGTSDEEFIQERFRDPVFIARAIVADMDIEDGNGEKVPYTPENGEKVLGNPAYAHFREWVMAEAGNLAQFYAKELEADVGNSRNGSSGKRAGAGKSKKTGN